MATEPAPAELELFCLVHGEWRENDIFSVQIKRSAKVSTLRHLIRDERANTFRNIEVTNLNLYYINISIPDDGDLKPIIDGIQLGNPLRTLRLLSDVFPSPLPDDSLHVLIKSDLVIPTHPYRSLDSEPLRLNCLVLGEPRNRIFPVQIAAEGTVGDLKDAIKDKKRLAFQHVDPDVLVLWKVSIPSNEIVQGLQVDLVDENSLSPTNILSSVFSESPALDHVHVMVKLPTLARAPKNTPPSAYKPPTADVKTLRTQFLSISPSKPPSSGGEPKEFRKRQAIPNRAIYCNRPLDVSAAIPVTLLHPIFGQFVDDYENHKPTKRDNALVRELSKAMSNFYAIEDERGTHFRRVFMEFGIHLKQTTVEGTMYRTDGDISHKDFRFVIAEMKNEIGGSGAEPFMQGILYYLESTRGQAPEMHESVLPCLIILIAGPHMGIAGAAWNDRPVIQMLSPIVPLHFHNSDTKLKAMAARLLGALKNAISSLEKHYIESEPSVVRAPPRSQIFPYQTHFASDSNSEQHFEYVTQPSDDRLLFFGKQSDGRDICIKFTRHYSPEAHSLCASIGSAPELLGFETLHGGWYMVVMDLIGKDYVEFHELRSPPKIFDGLRDVLSQLHQAGYVHGDIRDTNIMVSKGDELRNGEPRFRLVDFDWAGKIGEVQYPANVYRGKGLWRPDGACDGEFITAEHDIQMLEHLFAS